MLVRPGKAVTGVTVEKAPTLSPRRGPGSAGQERPRPEPSPPAGVPWVPGEAGAGGVLPGTALPEQPPYTQDSGRVTEPTAPGRRTLGLCQRLISISPNVCTLSTASHGTRSSATPRSPHTCSAGPLRPRARPGCVAEPAPSLVLGAGRPRCSGRSGLASERLGRRPGASSPGPALRSPGPVSSDVTQRQLHKLLQLPQTPNLHLLG